MELTDRQIDIIKIVGMIGLTITMLVLIYVAFTYEPKECIQPVSDFIIDTKEVIK